MPTFVFTAPDGKTYEVAGPEGATKEQAFGILQQRMGSAPAEPKPAPAAKAPPLEPMNVDPTEGMGWGEKALVNLGAGIDTTIQGAKQLFGKGPNDEELAEKRRIDKHLAEQTTGGGLIQTAGEILPSVPIGMGAALAAPAVGLGALAASPTLSAMGGGALSGALLPTMSDESRLTNTALGAAGGGVAPHVLKLATRGAGLTGAAAERIGAALPGALGRASAEKVGRRRTAEILKRELADAGPLPDVYTGAPGLQKPSAAVATQSPALAALERGSRNAGGEHWAGFDEAAQNARWGRLDRDLQGPADLDRVLSQADAVGARVPYLAVGEPAFIKEMDEFYAALQGAKQTPQYHANPAVKSAVDFVESTMREAGSVTPELMHGIRRTLQKGLTGAPGAGEAGVRAAQSEPFVLDIVKSIDNHLDNSSAGAWNQWKGDYADLMRQAEGAKADMNIRGKFVDAATGSLRKPSTGVMENPQVTASALKQAVASAGSMKRGPRKGQNILAPQSEAALRDVSRDLDMQAILQRSKATSTGGSGSDTASNLAQAAIMEGFLPSGLGVATYIKREGNAKAQREMQRQLAELLQDPDALRAFLQGQEAQRLLRGSGLSVPGAGAAGASLLLGGSNE